MIDAKRDRCFRVWTLDGTMVQLQDVLMPIEKPMQLGPFYLHPRMRNKPIENKLVISPCPPSYYEDHMIINKTELLHVSISSIADEEQCLFFSFVLLNQSLRKSHATYTLGSRAYPGRPFMPLDSCNQLCILQRAPQAFFSVQYKNTSTIYNKIPCHPYFLQEQHASDHEYICASHTNTMHQLVHN